MTSATSERPPIVRTRALSKTYPGDVHAVIDLDMEIQAGEIYGFLGPNGAGKSTTLGCITSLVRPTSGRIVVDAMNHYPGEQAHQYDLAQHHQPEEIFQHPYGQVDLVRHDPGRGQIQRDQQQDGWQEAHNQIPGQRTHRQQAGIM